ncbi:flagellin [Dasania marina]|uniref:flagellin N-terminal helical domain-containing protein n=1 Tax=Dasania marina TaxID=471499 RepID=UPI000376657C|nr:flagellin [Dasania marina]|tara:strand:+ start:46797 stop:47594 length:798 start_codon:yes stop_codon:yes gene_type:complete
MSQVVATNLASINAQRNLSKSGSSLATSLQRLSSGLRINSAKDDAAGLQISNQLTSQIRGTTVAARNASDGISYAQIAEGALDEIGNIYQRMRELAVQSANGTNSTSERTALNSEYTSLNAEVTRIAAQTRFGNTTVFTGTATALQVGDKAGETISFTIGTVTANGGAIATAAGASAALGTLTTSITGIDAKRGTLGAIQNRLESTIANSRSIIENASAARSRIRDADFAVETANLTRAQILQQAGTAMLTQANQIPQGVLSLLQ